MRLRAQNFVLGFAALACFLDGFLAPKESDPGPMLTVVMGILMVRRAVIITPMSPVVILAGCVLSGIAVGGNHRLMNVNAPIWIALVIIAAVCYALWERIEGLWNG